MKVGVILIIAAGLTPGPARPSPSAQASSSADSETKFQGEVRNFKAGSLLEIDIGDKRSKSYDLKDKDTIYRLDPDLARGRKVSIVESHDAGGRKLVEVRLKG